MSLWKWIVFAAFVSAAAVLAARKFKSFRAQFLAQFPPPDGRKPGNIWGSRRHLNPHGDRADLRRPEPDPKDKSKELK